MLRVRKTDRINDLFCSIYYCPNCGQLQKHSELTKTEIEVLRAYGEGLTTGEIAELRCISAKTVEAHRQGFMLKIGCSTLAAAMIWAVRTGIIVIDRPGLGRVQETEGAV